MDTGLSAINRVSYVFAANDSFNLLKYREVSTIGTTLVQTYNVTEIDFGFTSLVEAIQFDDFGVFKDSNETSIYI